VHSLIVLLAATFIVDLPATEELLGVGLMVEDHTKACSHVDSLLFAVEEDILSAVLAPVTIHVLKLVAAVGLRGVGLWWVVRGDDGTDPRLRGHELLAGLVLYLEEISNFAVPSGILLVV